MALDPPTTYSFPTTAAAAKPRRAVCMGAAVVLVDEEQLVHAIRAGRVRRLLSPERAAAEEAAIAGVWPMRQELRLHDAPRLAVN